MVFGPSKPQQPQPGASTVDNLKNRQAYSQHVQDADTNGTPRLTYEQWLAQQQAQQAQVKSK
jgi:hypothetical protein